MSYQDYPTEPIGGGNPYYRCVCCKRSAPEINGQPDRHAAWCDYRPLQAEAVPSDVVRDFEQDLEQVKRT